MDWEAEVGSLLEMDEDALVQQLLGYAASWEVGNDVSVEHVDWPPPPTQTVVPPITPYGPDRWAQLKSFICPKWREIIADRGEAIGDVEIAAALCDLLVGTFLAGPPVAVVSVLLVKRGLKGFCSDYGPMDDETFHRVRTKERAASEE